MKKTKNGIILAFTVLAIMLSFTVLPVYAENDITVPKIRRDIDSDVPIKQYSSADLSSYIYRDNLNKYSGTRLMNFYSVSNPKYNGNVALRMNYLNKSGAEIGDTIAVMFSNTTATPRGVDLNTTALRFMYNPVMPRQDTYVSLTCRTKNGVSQGQNSAALKIRLNDYIEIKPEDYTQTAWIPVTIPINYFLEYGTFDAMGGSETEFKTQCINGMMLEYSTEDLPETATSGITVAYLDDAEFVSVVREPQNLRYVNDDSSVTILWNGLSQNYADKYYIYRDGRFVKEISGATSYTDDTVSGDAKHIYSVCSVSAEGEKSVASHIEVDMSNVISSGTYTEKHIAYSSEDKSVVDDNVRLVINWNRHSTATQAGSSDNYGKALSYFAAGNSPMHQRKGEGESFSLPDNDRYRVLPITTTKRSDSTITVGTEPLKGASFYSAISDFDKSKIIISSAKGKGYTAANIEGLKLGLAYVDLDTQSSYTTSSNTTQTVYATGIKWLDVTNQFSALPAYNNALSWEDVSGDIEVDVSEALSNGEEKYIHGASAASHSVTLQNANAIVFDIVTKNEAYKSSSPVILFDSIRVDKSVTSELEGENELSLNITLCDKDGNTYNQISTAGTYPDRIVVDTYNTTKESKTAKLAAALYDSNKYLVDIKTYDVSIPLGKDSAVFKTGFYQDIPGDYTMKFFAFENYGNIKPISSKTWSQYSVSTPQAKSSAVVLDNEYQTITGWGISPFFISDKDFKTFTEYEDWQNMYDKVYGELGITSVRVPIDATCGYTDEPEDSLKDKPIASELDYVVKYIERAKDFGIDDWILCFWSPPKYMIEKQYFSERSAELYCLKDEYKDIYCSYIINVLDYLKNAGMGTPKGLCFQNEPGGGTSGPLYVREAYVYVAMKLRTELDNNGYTDVPITGFESSQYNNCFRYTGGSYGNVAYNYITSNPEFAESIGIFSSHAYYSSDETDADVQRFINVMEQFPQKERWMTEVSGLGMDECTLSNGTYDYVMGPAISTMRILSSDVGWVGMNRWYYWRAYTSHYNNDANGASYDVLNDKYSQQAVLYGTTGGPIFESKLYNCLKILFNNVPVGSRVKRVSLTDTDFVNKVAIKSDVVAFETDTGTVVMLVNKSETAKNMDFSGLTGDNAKIMSVIKDHDTIEVSKEVTSGTAFDVHIPPRSVNYIITNK